MRCCREWPPGTCWGSDTETVSFARGSVVYRPAGNLHALDPSDPVNVHAGAVGYAICGRPVRVWQGQFFDPADPVAHDGCVAAMRAAAEDRAGPDDSP